jgi:serine/threonine protein kinase
VDHTASPTPTRDEDDPSSKFDEADMQVQASMTVGEMAFSRDKSKAKLSDFEFRKLIGKGTFGKVFMVQNKFSGELYAMKCIRKDVILENEQMENIQLEKDILYQIAHPFLVNMEFVFQNEFRIYFLMKFVKGGELFRHLVTVKRFPEDQAKFFAAQVAMALGHLHSKKIIYRDLKPENVLVGEDGKFYLPKYPA